MPNRIVYNPAAMQQTTAIYSLQQAAHCPRCGYDQRGRAVGDVCPECGERCDVGVAIEQINRWARCSITDLWCVAVLQTVGVCCALIAFIAADRSHPVAGLLTAAAVTYLCSAIAWYLIISFGFLRRRLGPNYHNLSTPQKKAVSRWLIVDFVALTAPAALLILPWFLRGL